MHPAECSQTTFQKNIFDSPFEACESLKKRKRKSSCVHREIFNGASKVIRNFPGFTSLRYVIGPESSGHFLNQSDSKLKPIAAESFAFSRASSRALTGYLWYFPLCDWLF